MQGVINALLSTILVSIPEELFLTGMTLILLKRFDMLDIRMWKQNLKWIIIPVLSMSVNINTTKYILQLPKVTCSLSSLIIFIITFTYIIRKNSFEFKKRDYCKLFVCIIFSLIMFGFLEGCTYPIMLYLMNQPLDFLNTNILWNFILSIPSRILGFSIVIYLIIQHNNIVEIKIFETISKNRFLLYSFISFTIMSNVIAIYVLKLIGSDRILENKVSMIEQSFIVMGALVIPAIILFWMLLLINYLLVKERQIQQTYKNLVMQDDVMLDVEDLDERR